MSIDAMRILGTVSPVFQLVMLTVAAMTKDFKIGQRVVEVIAVDVMHDELCSSRTTVAPLANDETQMFACLTAVFVSPVLGTDQCCRFRRHTKAFQPVPYCRLAKTENLPNFGLGKIIDRIHTNNIISVLTEICFADLSPIRAAGHVDLLFRNPVYGNRRSTGSQSG
jgi:hypothetical protein